MDPYDQILKRFRNDPRSDRELGELFGLARETVRDARTAKWKWLRTLRKIARHYR